MPSLDPSAIDALPHHRPEAILAHSCFAEARHLFVEGSLGLYEHDPVLTRLLTEAAPLRRLLHHRVPARRP